MKLKRVRAFESDILISDTCISIKPFEDTRELQAAKKRLVSVTQSKTKGASVGLILARAFLGSKQPLNLKAVSTPPPSIARWPRLGMMRMGYLKKQLTAANRSEVLPKPARGAEERYAAVICALAQARVGTCNTS